GAELVQVHELFEASDALRVLKEGVRAGRIPQENEVLKEGNLHPGAVDQHAWMPSNAGVPLDKETGPVRVDLPGAHGQGDVGRAKPDPENVEWVPGVPDGLPRHRGERSGESPSISPRRAPVRNGNATGSRAVPLLSRGRHPQGCVVRRS